MQEFISQMIALIENLRTVSGQTVNEIENKINDISSDSDVDEIEIF
ncbi:MAG: hypothetical protein IKB25_09820 [Lentisphaeria bacterium]|nr:hypothetical protein [Lentisphaeria bacterium]